MLMIIMMMIILLQTGGGIRELPEGLLQEADWSTEPSDHLTAGLPLQGRQTEGDDHLHH